MVTAENPQEPHSVHGARLLDHAGAALADGDRLQVSEKIWGAVSHALREVAEVAAKRRWPISVNADARDVERYIAQETGDSELAALGGAELYHYNFYQDAMDVEDIKDGLAMAERICGELLAANDALPSSLPPPCGPKFRAYERRNGLAPDPPYTSEEWAAFVRTRDRLAAQARPRRRVGPSAVGGPLTPSARTSSAAPRWPGAGRPPPAGRVRRDSRPVRRASAESPSPYKGRGRRECGGRGYCGRRALRPQDRHSRP